jgi:hypothetical protein
MNTRPRVWRHSPGTWVVERVPFGFTSQAVCQRPHRTFEAAIDDALGRRHSIGTPGGSFERE